MRVLRSSLFVAATAIIAAACGDKITVPAQTTTAAKINSVQVAPSTASITVGQSITLTAAINADAGLTTTTTWSTSSAAAATVTQAGVVTGVASSPGVAICASVTAAGANTVQNCASVSVSPVQAIVPATVQITSVTTVNLNTPAPVPPGVVAGQINVSVTANPGTARLDSVVVFINGIAAGTQTLTAAQAAALRAAAEAAVAEQQVVAPIVFSINTAAYNTTTGAVTFPNGPMVISAVAYGHQGSAASTNAASQSVSYILGNVDGFQVTVVNNGNKANDAAGFAWWGNGTVTVNALPVMYSGKTVGSVTASLGSGATGGTCAAGVGAAVTATTATAGVWVNILPLTAVQSPAGCTTTNPNLPLITATDNNGNVLVLGGITTIGGAFTGALNAQTGVRIDNIAPPTAGVIAALAVNGRTNNWINDAVSLNTVTSATNLNGAIAAGVVDAGVGAAGGAGTGVTYTVKVATTYALAKTAAGLATTSSLPMLATNASYCAVVYTSDALGNTTLSPTGTCAAPTQPAGQVAPAAGVAAVTFGVDRVAPLVGYGAASIASNARISTGTIGAEMIVTFSDTGVVGNSGMAPATPVVASLILRNVPATGAATCIVGTFASSVCGQSTTGMTTTLATGSSTTAIGGTSVVGYYTFNATATDAAGNSTTVAPRVFVFDNTAPTVGVASTPVTVSGTAGFAASSFVSEDLDIQNFTWGVNYGTFPFAPLQFAQGGVTTVNGFNANPFINTNYVASSTVTLPLAFQAAAAATLYPLSTVQAIVLNQANLSATGAAAGPTTVTPGTAISLTGFTSYPADALPAGITGLSSGVSTTATAAAPLNSTLSAVANGVTATFNNPFTRVDFYAVNFAGTQWTLIGSVATPSVVDIGGNRAFTWALPVSGSALYTQLGFTGTATVNVVGVGIGAANNAIGMIPAAAFGLNIIK